MEELDLREKFVELLQLILQLQEEQEKQLQGIFLSTYPYFSTDSGLVVLIVIILFTFSHGYLVYLTKKDTKFLKYLEVI